MQRNGLQDGGIVTGTMGVLLSGTNAQVVIKSNMTPDITVKLSDLLSPPSDGAPKVISSQDENKLQWIKPELELRTMGTTVSTYAPYGTPSKEAFIYFSIAIIIMSLMGAKIAWTMCRSLSKR
jgi:hypothetical protein